MTISSIFFTAERMNGAVTLVSLVSVRSQPVVAYYLRQLSEAHPGSVMAIDIECTKHPCKSGQTLRPVKGRPLAF